MKHFTPAVFCVIAAAIPALAQAPKKLVASPALQKEFDDFIGKFSGLKLRRYPWRATKVPRLVEELSFRRLPRKEKPE